MRAEIEAVRARLAPLGRPAFAFDVVLATGETKPSAYYLVELGGGARPDDVALSGATSEWSLTVRVKAVATTAEAALTHVDAARALLTPSGRTTALTVTGRGAWLAFTRHEADYVDRDVRPHKYLSVDSYALTSVPA